MAHPILSIKRVFRSAIKNVRRNTWFAIASVTIMTLTLVTASGFFVLTLLVNQAADAAKTKVGLATVSIKSWVSEKEIGELKKQIEGVPGVEEVRYVSKEEALHRFRIEHKDDTLLLQAVADQNPLYNSLEVRVKEPENFALVKTKLEERKLAGKVQEFSFQGDRQATIERIASVSNFIKKLGLGLSLVFIVVASVIIYNTVRLGIFSRRTEIEVMYLNGATRGFIRAPFLIEGGLYGLVAVLLTVLILYLFMGSFGSTLSNYFGGLGDLNGYIGSNVPMLLVALAGIGVGVGFFSSWLAVSKHIEV